MNHWSDKLPEDACSDASDWCRGQSSLSAAWSSCGRGDWMLWLAGRISGETDSLARRKLVGCAAECARIGLVDFERRYPNDRCVRDCLDLCDRYAAGDESVTLDQLRSAATAAYNVADEAAASYADSAYAASAAAVTAVAAFIAHPLHAATAVARAGAPAACSNIVRKWYPTPPELKP